jgi:hypothetical protein
MMMRHVAPDLPMANVSGLKNRLVDRIHRFDKALGIPNTGYHASRAPAIIKP